MYARSFVLGAVFALMIGSGTAQTLDRRAVMTGGGNADQGKCTIEVLVDGVAEVEVRGENATLRNLSGQPPQWRRFQCTATMPVSPADFRFVGVDGRGKQELIRDPRNGGVAVVRIEDSQGGTEGYTFDLIWTATRGYPTNSDPNRGLGRENGPLGQRAPDNRTYPDQRNTHSYPDQRDTRGIPDQRDTRSYPDQRDNRGSDDRFNQERDQRDQDVYHRDREQWFGNGNWQGHLFARVKEDLSHIQSVTFPFSGDQYRLSRTLQQLDLLQSKLSAGRYDQQALDEVIGALQQVAQDNRLSPRDRSALGDDVNRLRDFRARHGYYGAR
jgi:hypothetical protein